MMTATSKTRARLSLVAMLAVSPLAFADGAPPRTLDPAVTIRFNDLNLSTPQGARVLYGRIRVAAQRVCGPSFSVWDAGRWAKWKVCYNQAVETAVREVNQPALTAVHNRLIAIARR